MLLLMARMYNAQMLTDDDLEMMAHIVEITPEDRTITALAADTGASERTLTARAIRMVPVSAGAMRGVTADGEVVPD